MVGQINKALRVLLLLTLLTGCLYPLMVTGIAQLFFQQKANGSLVKYQNQIVGSALIGQLLTEPRYFWGRPSAIDYHAESSSGSNLGPSNPLLLQQVEERRKALQGTVNTPIDLVTTSGSGLDPDISPEGALFQIPRVAKARNVSEKELQALVEKMITPRSLGFLGEARVNVLTLNLALERGPPW